MDAWRRRAHSRHRLQPLSAGEAGLAGDHLIFNLTGLHVGGLEGQEFLSPSLAPAAGRGQSGRDRFGASDLVGLLQDLCTRGKFIHSHGRTGIRGLKRRIRTRPDASGRVRLGASDLVVLAHELCTRGKFSRNRARFFQKHVSLSVNPSVENPKNTPTFRA